MGLGWVVFFQGGVGLVSVGFGLGAVLDIFRCSFLVQLGCDVFWWAEGRGGFDLVVDAFFGMVFGSLVLGCVFLCWFLLLNLFFFSCVYSFLFSVVRVLFFSVSACLPLLGFSSLASVYIV